MNIMVIQGREGPVRETVLNQLVHLKNPRVVTIDVGFVPDASYRVARLRQLLNRSRKVLNVVIGANSEEEITFLRQQSALFCNVHRHFPSHLLNVPGAISHDDVLVSPFDYSEFDVLVLKPDEAFAECLLRSRQRRRPRHVA